MVIGALLLEATGVLTTAGISSARLDCEVLLAHVMGKDRLFLAVHRNEEVPEEAERAFRGLLQRRREHEPVAYLTGMREFMSLTFSVEPGVLIPRPDTETLVEYVIEKLKSEENPGILDLCTGSGAIAVSLAYYLKNSFVTAVDISKTCVAVARNNAEKNGVSNRVQVIEQDVFRLSAEKTYDCVVSNPPYIPTAVVEGLERDVKEYEPKTALDGGADGLDFYRHLATLGADLLRSGGLFALEVGHDQAEIVQHLLEETNRFESTGLCCDLAGIRRVVYAVKK